jgi:DNA repair exonuclease SbcCD nuclease subunit
MAKFIVASDLHIRSKTWARLPLYGDSYVALQEVVELTRQHQADALILPGDLFSTAFGADTPSNVKELLNITKDVREIVYTVGNHDKTGAPHGSRNPEWVEALDVSRSYYDNALQLEVKLGSVWHYEDGKVYTVAGVKFAVIHHTASVEELQNKLKQLARRRFDVLVMHQGLKEMISLEGKFEISSGEVAELLADTGVCCVLCGHVHKSKAWEVQANGRVITFISPGATFKETLATTEQDCQAVLLELDHDAAGKYVVKLTWIPLLNQREIWHKNPLPADAERCLEYANFIREVGQRQSGKDPRVSVPVVSFSYVAMPGFLAQLEEAAGDKVCLDITAAQASILEFLKELAAGKESVTSTDEDTFPAIAQKYADGLALETLLEVHRGEDPETAISRMLTKITQEETV